MSLEERRQYISRCPRCSQCKWVPTPKSQQFAPICPSIQYGNFHSYSASGKGFTAFAILENRMVYSQEMLRSIFACTMCGACDTACKTNMGDNVEPLDTLYELRAHVVQEGHALAAHITLIEGLMREGNPLGKPRGERIRFADGLAVKDATQQPVDVLLYVGSDASYDEEQWSPLRFLIKTLTAAGIDFGTLGNAEVDSGGMAFDIGFRKEALTLAQRLAGLVAKSKAQTIVTYCADAYAAFRSLYPRLGVTLGDVRVVHVSEYLLELLNSGSIQWRLSSNEAVAYHDPCKLGRLSEPYENWSGTWRTVLNVVHIAEPPRRVRFGTGGNYDAPRELIKRVAGARLLEMERAREYSYCCGAGGGAKEAFPDFAEHTAADRLVEAASTGASTLVTSCARCHRHLKEIAAKRRSPLKVKSLLELLCDATIVHAASSNQ